MKFRRPRETWSRNDRFTRRSSLCLHPWQNGGRLRSCIFRTVTFHCSLGSRWRRHTIFRLDTSNSRGCTGGLIYLQNGGRPPSRIFGRVTATCAWTTTSSPRWPCPTDSLCLLTYRLRCSSTSSTASACRCRNGWTDCKPVWNEGADLWAWTGPGNDVLDGGSGPPQDEGSSSAFRGLCTGLMCAGYTLHCAKTAGPIVSRFGWGSKVTFVAPRNHVLDMGVLLRGRMTH